MNQKPMRSSTPLRGLSLLSALVFLGLPGGGAHAAVKVDEGTISGLSARNIGSATMSGRVAALAGFNTPDGKVTLYVAAASGGVWKSADGGTTFRPVFDKQPVQSIGAVAVDPTNRQVVWVGTGESWTRNSVSIGDGIYKSVDGGDTWANVGLPESERITRIIVHPKIGRIVYACVPGKLWSDSAERGLYKTSDGGKTWALILKGPNLSTGCGDVSMDPANPKVLFASLWDFRRKAWTFRSGGDGPAAFSGSGLFKSVDAGKTWTEVTPGTNKSFGAKPYGRIAVKIAPSNPKIVYAAVESTRSALFRSDDGGATWQERDRSSWMVWRPFYFSNLIVDPKNPDRLFKPDGTLIVSSDGGKSFAVTGGFAGMHGDVHDLWIDPANTQHIVAGDDGGLWHSYDGGARWWKGGNLPLSQFYHVSVDDKDPYQVYGGLQDNSSWAGDTQYPGGITNDRWEKLFWGDGFWTYPDPADPDFVYAELQGGYIGRVNRKTYEYRFIQPATYYKEKMRWHWNAPIALSPNDKDAIYIGSQYLFRSRDHGQSWDRLSPDLTTNDPEKQKQEESGGVTVDNSSAEMHCTIYTISESPKSGKVIWVGTDDGNLQLTRDGGKRWTNVVANVPGLPPASTVSWVEASRYDAAVAYAAFDRHTFGDMDPYLYRTTDYGQTWTRLVAPGQGVRGYAHVIREDTVKSSLLFLGTELGLWISLDGGAQWAQFKGGEMPNVAVRDLVIQPRESDLVIATHGRGIWIVDDITPLRGLTSEVLESELAFLDGRPQQQRLQANGGGDGGQAVFVGDNPPDGVVLNYYQRTRHLFGKLKLEILDEKGGLIDTLPASPRRGLNRVVWNMRLPPPRVPPAATQASGGTQGPRVVPGTYIARLTKGGQVYEKRFTVALDRRARFDLSDRKAHFDAVMQIHGLFGEMSDFVGQITGLQQQAQARTAKADDALKAKLVSLSSAADEVRRKIVATKEGGAITGEERLREHTDTLYLFLLLYEGRPGKYHLERIATLRREFDDARQEFAALVARDVPGLNEALAAAGLEPLPTP
jgi:photosystem II stability/assembly factor-like uncharacterized protein